MLNELIDIRDGIKECNGFIKYEISRFILNMCTHWLEILVSYIYHHVLYVFFSSHLYFYQVALAVLFCVNKDIIIIRK